jgi:hypothetical protein
MKANKRSAIFPRESQWGAEKIILLIVYPGKSVNIGKIGVIRKLKRIG